MRVRAQTDRCTQRRTDRQTNRMHKHFAICCRDDLIYSQGKNLFYMSIKCLNHIKKKSNMKIFEKKKGNILVKVRFL